MNRWMLTPNKLIPPEQVNRIMEMVKINRVDAETNNKNQVIKECMILDLVFHTGLRVAEICGLICGNLYIADSSPSILIFGKGKKWRQIRVSRFLAERLAAFLSWKKKTGEPAAAESWLFLSNRGTKYSRSSVQKIFKKYLAKAGLPGTYSIHCARHSYATMLYKASGHNLRLVQKQLGHSSVSTTQIYADVCDNEAQAAVERLYA